MRLRLLKTLSADLTRGEVYTHALEGVNKMMKTACENLVLKISIETLVRQEYFFPPPGPAAKENLFSRWLDEVIAGVSSHPARIIQQARQ